MELSSLVLLYATLVMGYAAIEDVKRREVDTKVWILATLAGAPFSALAALADVWKHMLFLLSSLLLVTLAYALYRLCLIGGADVLAMAFIALIAPAGHLLLPPLFLAVLYSPLSVLAYQLYSNYLFCGSLEPRCLLAFSHKVEARRLIEDPRLRWWVVSGEACKEESQEDIVLRASGGELSLQLEASPGHPYVAHLAVGMIATLLLGDLPIRFLLEELGIHFL